MRAIRVCVVLSVVAALLCVFAVEATAIPVFARKYGFNCTMCHSNFPRLNDFGVRYRQNGYQVPGREEDEKTILETQAPFAMRTSVGLISDNFRNTGELDVNEFRVNSLDLLSGGLIARNIGYLVIYPPEIKGLRGVAAQTGTLEMANVIFSNLGCSRSSVRVGRFEPAYVAFSGKRILTFSPYEIYDFAFPANPNESSFAFADTQTGVEFAGYGAKGLSYAAGWVNGSDTNESDDFPRDFYLRWAKVIGSGEGQTVGTRLGLTGYFGKARPAASLPTASRRAFNRFGLDGSFNFGIWNVGVQYLRGKDNAALWGAASDVDFSGGFVELSCLPRSDSVGFLRWDWVNTPGAVNGDVSRWTVGGRRCLVDNVAVHLEYSHRAQNQTGLPDATESFFMAGLDFAF